jgi:hypothetical protein
MLTRQNIHQACEPYCRPATDSFLYGLIDHAGLPGLVAKLTESASEWMSLFDSEDPDTLSVAPLLVRIGTGQDGIQQRRLVRWLVQQGTYGSSLVLMASPLSLKPLAHRLTARLDAVVSENMEVLLRYFDPRVFEQLIVVLSPEQKQAFLSVARHWWFVDRSGHLKEVPATFFAMDNFTSPLALNAVQESALLDASEPDQVAQLLQSGAPIDYEALRQAERYDFILRHMAAARQFGVEATHELSLYCALAMLHGEHFAAGRNWQAALHEVKQKKISLAQVAIQMELNESITGQT